LHDLQSPEAENSEETATRRPEVGKKRARCRQLGKGDAKKAGLVPGFQGSEVPGFRGSAEPRNQLDQAILCSATTVVVIPPRAVKAPVTVMRRG
jgi:hypothetical protein